MRAILPFILCIQIGVLSFAQTVELEKLTIKDGLSQGFVPSILQTQDGFLWFSTQIGLNRYDGTEIAEYLHDPFVPFSPSQKNIAFLSEDNQGRMWVRYDTKGLDLDVYNPTTGRFHKIELIGETPKVDYNTTRIEETPDGAFWMGGLRFEIDPIFLDTTQQETITVPFERIVADFPATSTSTSYLNTFLSKDSSLYLLTTNAFYFIDWKTKKHRLLHSFRDPFVKHNSMKWVIGNSILETPSGRLWLSYDKVYYLENNSLLPVKTPTGEKGNLFISEEYLYFGGNQLNRAAFQQVNGLDFFYENVIKPESYSNFLLKSPVVDRSGTIWFGTNGFGVRKFNPFKRKFQHYLARQTIRNVALRDDGKLWYSGNSNKALQFDINQQKIVGKLNNLKWVTDLIMGKGGVLWAAGGGHGIDRGPYLLKIDTKSGTQKLYRPNTNLVGFRIPNKVQRCLLDGNHIWLLGVDSLALFSIEKEEFEYFDLMPLKYSAQQEQIQFTCLSKATDNQIWVGSTIGLFRIDIDRAEKKIASLYFHSDLSDPTSLRQNHIWSICPDPANPQKTLWLGTNGGGFARMDVEKGQFLHFTKKDGLPNNVVYAILPDSKNGLWMSTNFGLSHFVPSTKSFTNFTEEDGLQNNEFNAGASYLASDGTMCFGGINGVTVFHPDNLQLNRHIPPIVITDLTINNEKVDYRSTFLKDKNSILQQPIEQTKTIHLAHHQNVITLRYAALDFAVPSKNRYRRQMVGVDDDWVEANHETNVQYANLPPGEYLFKVIGSNNDGIWNEEPATLEIIIHPPWWQTKWAYALYLLFFLSGLFGLYRFQIERVKERNQLAFEKKESERLAELDRIKTDFFSNVTHEFRTPLTLILEPIRQLLKKDFDGEVRQQLSLVKNNSEKMLSLVNQLLDMAKLEGGKMELDMRQGNILETVRPIFQSFLVLAKKKDIYLRMSGLNQIEPFYFDKMKVEKVVANLLSNAVKFTEKGEVKLEIGIRHPAPPAPKGGQHPATTTIDGDVGGAPPLGTGHTGGQLILTISDTGKGIPEKALPHVFDRFYQVDSSSTRAGEGTGIGLALTKELVELMDGIIEVESDMERGTVFKVVIPMLKESAISTAEEMTPFPLPATVPSLRKNVTSSAKAPTENNNPTIQQSNNLILLIEDNAELRTFLKTSLDKIYQVIEASNGAEGIRKAKELIPDLIVSDLMMPEKDGFEVCGELKNDWLTSHVPIILLTAKSAIDSKIKGLRTGADAYLTKPFHSEELQVRIEKLIEGREHLQEKFSQIGEAPSIKKSVEQLPKIENEFLRQLTLLVENHLDNEKLTVEALAEQLFMSRSQVFRKVKAITGQSPNEFIRNYRLDRAMELLKNKEGNISQIAMMVGFGDEKYFSTRFKGRFGQSPSEVS